ncbi:hypothetical protein M2323_003926 [Rhodoblastus acidophilus]|nr:hypothetical protein [Rhodoblastus acidophilus]MCW2334983.1 hypothetical protein [Rhodoblastus acidophilus]
METAPIVIIIFAYTLPCQRFASARSETFSFSLLGAEIEKAQLFRMIRIVGDRVDQPLDSSVKRNV